jgi:hypothetical protein
MNHEEEILRLSSKLFASECFRMTDKLIISQLRARLETAEQVSPAKIDAAASVFSAVVVDYCNNPKVTAHSVARAILEAASKAE